jgi:hypothetical protein
VLNINSKITPFSLPITLLDQGLIKKRLSLDEINSFINLYGRIYKTFPMHLSLNDCHQNYVDLPHFFGRPKRKESRILGTMAYSILTDQDGEVMVSVYLR